MCHRTVISVAIFAAAPLAAEPPKLTTLSDESIDYTVPEKGYVTLSRAGVEAVIVDNRAVNDDVLPGHRAGYSGVASLRGPGIDKNFFVPNYAGLNFEHIHDGTTEPRDVLFEPRQAPMELRLIDEHTAELYQAPTPTWKLESCLRYHMLEDGTIEMTFECIPREKTFANGYVGLFWASYVNQPESLDIHFRGFPDGKKPSVRWVRGVTPGHGTEPTHFSPTDERRFPRDEDFPLTLVFNRSRWRYAEPWYFGVNGGAAFAQMFRPGDRIRLTQSPSGGGRGNPAWDFQFFIPEYEVGRRYQMVMRAMLVKYVSPEQVAEATAKHREELAK